MKNEQPDSVVAAYLARLELALGPLPAPRRQQLLEEVAQHVAEARRELPAESPAALHQLLERVGSPEDIATAALEEDGLGRAVRASPEEARNGLAETLAIALLLFGGFFFVVGWLVGVVLLWASDRWRLRDKLLGTLVFPGGLALVVPLISLPTSTTASTTTCVPATAPTTTLLAPGQSPPSHALHPPAGLGTAHVCGSAGSGVALPVWAGVAILLVIFVGCVMVAVHLHHARQTQGRRYRTPSANGQLPSVTR